MNSRVLVAALILSCLGFASCKKDERPDVSQSLIDAFANSCTSRGFWTDAALFHTNALAGVLENLKATDPCKPFEDTLLKIQALDSQMSYLLNNTAYKDYRASEEAIQEIQLELDRLKDSTNATDLAVVDQLKPALASARASLATKRAAAGVDSYYAATAQLGQAVQSMSTRAKDLSACLQSSPAASLQLATNAMALGGSFISPVIGAGIGTIGQLLNGAVEYVRHSATNDAIWKLHAAKMPMALTCGLEAMTELNCQANDAYSLLQLQDQNYPQHSQKGPNDMWKSLDILSRRMPVLVKYFEKLKAGVISNREEASRQAGAWDKTQQVQRVGIYVEGMLAELTQAYVAAEGKDDARLNIVIEFVDILANGLVGKCPENRNSCYGFGGVFAQVSNDPVTHACALVLGREAAKTECPKFDKNVDTADSYLRLKLLPLRNLDTLVLNKGFSTNWETIRKAAKDIADSEFTRTVTVDALSLLDAAFQDTPNNMSPREVLTLIQTFLTDIKDAPAPGNPHHAPLVAKTLQTVIDVSAALDNPNNDMTPTDRLNKIYDMLELKSGARIFLERLTSIAATDVRQRLKNGDFPDDVAELLRTSSIDVHLRLQAAGTDNIGQAITDLNGARSIIDQNIETFRTFFAPSFKRAIVELDKRAKRGPTPEPATGPNRPHGQTLAKLCLLMISTGYDDFDKKTKAICSKARLTSIYADPKNPEDPLDLEIGKVWNKIKNKPFMDRACVYHRYVRAERLAEIVKKSKLNSTKPPKPALELIEDLL